MNFDPLLINLLFILLPMIACYIIFSLMPSLPDWADNLIYAFGGAVSAIMCMHYSIELSDGFYYDLRLIPFILALFYGGVEAGVGMMLITLFYRMYMGGDGFFVTIVLLLVIIMIVAPLLQKFERSSIGWKLLLPIVVSLGAQGALLLNYLFFVNESFTLYWHEWVLLFVINTGTLAFLVYTIESLIKINYMREEVYKAENMKVISDLAASISHEVRNPLTVTRGFLQMLGNREISRDKEKEFLTLAIEELDRANKIISDYLTFSRPKLEHVQVLDVEEEINHTLGLITPMATMNGTEIKTATEKSFTIKGDKEKLQQCFLNVMKNGIEAMPRGGTLTVETVARNQTGLITFTDEGEGMTKEETQRLGTPYFSTKENGTGNVDEIMFVVFGNAKVGGFLL